ncbi:MAG: thiazole synthase [Deltaproteobacteria bacterium]|nr:thiazole synthase [Deltaproteobacteria bacterium]
MDKLTIFNKQFRSRLLVGTGKFPSGPVMRESLEASETEIVTVALRRVNLARPEQDILSFIDRNRFTLLPNTSGARNAKEAILLAHLAREAGLGNWLKLEVIPDPRYLLPDPIETWEAAKTLTKEGFTVLPYIQADPVLARKLTEAGCATVMPLAAPIGSGRGLRMKETIRIIIEQSTVPVIVDAGIGSPSDACEAMEMGADAVLVNTAIAVAENPVKMAEAFRLAVEAGRKGFLAGIMGEQTGAEASSPYDNIPDLLSPPLKIRGGSPERAGRAKGRGEL